MRRLRLSLTKRATVLIWITFIFLKISFRLFLFMELLINFCAFHPVLIAKDGGILL
jgi:hypothetical protein